MIMRQMTKKANNVNSFTEEIHTRPYGHKNTVYLEENISLWLFHASFHNFHNVDF